MAAAIARAHHVRKRENVFLVVVGVLKRAFDADPVDLAGKRNRLVHRCMVFVHFVDKRLQAILVGVYMLPSFLGALIPDDHRQPF